MEKDKIERLVLKYTGMASAILGVQSVNGQVIWTDLQDTTLSTNGAIYDLDIDQDTGNVVDFRIVQLVDSTIYNISGVLVRTGGNAANQVVGVNYSNYNYAFRLNVGDTIGPGNTFKGINQARNIGYLAFEVDGTTYPNSQWVDTTSGVTDGFLGLRFTAPTSDSTTGTFYGWVRLDVSADLRSVTIKEFAYQSQPDSSIYMGEGAPININEFEVERPAMVQRGKFLDISLPETYTPAARVKLIGLDGKMIREYALSGYKNQISLEDLPKGIMVAHISSNGVEATRKVVVY